MTLFVQKVLITHFLSKTRDARDFGAQDRADASEPKARCAPSGVGGGGGVGSEHDPEAADEVAAELCDAIRDMVAYVLQPSTVWELCWSLAGSSTIMDVQVLAADPLFASLAAGQRERLLDDQSAQTAVERGVQSRHMTSTTAAPTDAEPSYLREDA